MTPINQDVLINFVLDRSGSMHPVREATVEGFNGYIDTIREAPGEARLSLTLFDDTFDARFVATPLANVPRMGEPGNPYILGGSTALLDAVGTTIKGTEQWLINHPEFAGRVVCVVLTDGAENASRQWHLKHPTVDGDAMDLGGLIKWKQAEGWEFVFMGSGGSAWLERAFGHVLSHDSFLSFTNDAHTNRRVYAGAAKAMNMSRAAGTAYSAVTVASAVASDGEGDLVDPDAVWKPTVSQT